MTTRIHVIDSHTAGEPTRTVIAGAPDLGPGTVTEKLAVFRDRFDDFRSAVVNEPRGSDVLVGALLVPPTDPTAAAGVIFFNNVGYLDMCGHGTIGVAATLAHLGKIAVGNHRIETPVGLVTATLNADGTVSVENVPSFRKAKAVTVNVSGVGPIIGDVAWGGNWFFLVSNPGRPIRFSDVDELTDLAWKIRSAVNGQGYPEVDHVELFGPSTAADAKNFVLCPGKAYDRCPCGTGTSAKLACLAGDGKLAEGQSWVQEGILGTTFTGSYKNAGNQIIPTITGRAFVTADAQLILNPADPFSGGIRASQS